MWCNVLPCQTAFTVSLVFWCQPCPSCQSELHWVTETICKAPSKSIFILLLSCHFHFNTPLQTALQRLLWNMHTSMDSNNCWLHCTLVNQTKKQKEILLIDHLFIYFNNFKFNTLRHLKSILTFGSPCSPKSSYRVTTKRSLELQPKSN